MKSFQEQSLFLPFDLGSPPERLHFSSLPPSITRFFISNNGLLVKFFNLTLLIIASFLWTFWFGIISFFFQSDLFICPDWPPAAVCSVAGQYNDLYIISPYLGLLNPAPSVLSNVLWLVLTGNFQKKKNQTKQNTVLGTYFPNIPLNTPPSFLALYIAVLV